MHAQPNSTQLSAQLSLPTQIETERQSQNDKTRLLLLAFKLKTINCLVASVLVNKHTKFCFRKTHTNQTQSQTPPSPKRNHKYIFNKEIALTCQNELSSFYSSVLLNKEIGSEYTGVAWIKTNDKNANKYGNIWSYGYHESNEFRLTVDSQTQYSFQFAGKTINVTDISPNQWYLRFDLCE